jgi:phosphoglucosamine mutase
LMKKNNFNLGGEQSGHIILGKFATTGDGLLVALEVLFALRKGKSASEIFRVYSSVPQKLVNIKVKDKKIISTHKCKKAIKLANTLIKKKGRLLVRASGTEPKIRIMCESFNYSLIDKCINIIKKTIR